MRVMVGVRVRMGVTENCVEMGGGISVKFMGPRLVKDMSN